MDCICGFILLISFLLSFFYILLCLVFFFPHFLLCIYELYLWIYFTYFFSLSFSIFFWLVFFFPNLLLCFFSSMPIFMSKDYCFFSIFYLVLHFLFVNFSSLYFPSYVCFLMAKVTEFLGLNISAIFFLFSCPQIYIHRYDVPGLYSL